jgi:hypothetical protein
MLWNTGPLYAALAARLPKTDPRPSAQRVIQDGRNAVGAD